MQVTKILTANRTRWHHKELTPGRFIQWKRDVPVRLSDMRNYEKQSVALADNLCSHAEESGFNRDEMPPSLI